MKHLLYIGLILFTTYSSAQTTTSSISQIKATIYNYYDGYVERDGVKLTKAFDIENGVMKTPIIIDGKVTGYNNGNFKDIIPKWARRDKLSNAEMKECHLNILSMSVESNSMATAKIEMIIGDKTYIDILSLQKIIGQWKITNKMFVVM